LLNVLVAFYKTMFFMTIFSSDQHLLNVTAKRAVSSVKTKKGAKNIGFALVYFEFCAILYNPSPYGG